MRYYDSDHMSGGGWWLVALLVLVLIGLVTALLVVYLVRGGQASGEPGATDRAAPGPGLARAILDERLARGDIDPDDYRDRRALLESPPHPPG